MPRLAGVNLVGVALAALAMYLVGFVWYGLVFAGARMDALGFAAEDFEGQSPLWMAAGFVIEIVIAFGMGWVIKRMDVAGLGACILTGVTLALVIAVPVLGYAMAYQPAHSVTAWLIDSSHALAIFAVAGAVLSYFD